MTAILRSTARHFLASLGWVLVRKYETRRVMVRKCRRVVCAAMTVNG